MLEFGSLVCLQRVRDLLRLPGNADAVCLYFTKVLLNEDRPVACGNELTSVEASPKSHTSTR